MPRLDVGLRDPSLGDVREGLGVVGTIVLDGINGNPDVDAGGEVYAVDVDTAGKDFAGQDAADSGAETEGFVDAGAEIGAVV